MNNNEPLWMPRGSVRAILALFVVGTSIAYLAVQGGAEATTALVALGGAVIGYYFGRKDASEGTAGADE